MYSGKPTPDLEAKNLDALTSANRAESSIAQLEGTASNAARSSAQACIILAAGVEILSAIVGGTDAVAFGIRQLAFDGVGRPAHLV